MGSRLQTLSNKFVAIIGKTWVTHGLQESGFFKISRIRMRQILRCLSCNHSNVGRDRNLNRSNRRHLVIARRGSCFGKFCDAEVEHLNAISAQTIWFEPYVVRLEITVDDSLVMGFVHSRTDLLEYVYHPLDGEALLFS